MILVTGGTGLVGSHLLFSLTQKNEKVRAIYRTKESIEKTKEVFSFYRKDYEAFFSKIEWVKADITDIPSLLPVFKNVDYVYHCAALVSFQPNDYIAMRKININGTKNIANLSIDAKVKKLCYISSIASISDMPNKEFVDEENEWNQFDNNNGYAITKYGAEMEVWRAGQEGIDVVIVNPGVILGSGFWNAGSSKMFTQVFNGFKYYTNGITGFVGVKDVVNAMITLAESNITNERFILVSENKSFKQILISIAQNLKVKPATKEIKPWQTAIFWRIEKFLSFFGKSQRLTKQSAKSLHSVTRYKSDKIINTVGFSFTPINDVISETSADFLASKNL